MSNAYSHSAYTNNSVQTASPGELTLQLYNGCLKFLHRAKEAIDVGNISERNTNLIKTQAIINELTVTLNMDFPVSKNLASLYDFMNRTLIEANVRNDKTKVEEVEGLITDLRDTWKIAIQKYRQATYSGGAV